MRIAIRHSQLSFVTSVCVAVLMCGCNLPVSKLAPHFSPLNGLSAGSHGAGCCSTGECNSSKLSPFGQPLPQRGQFSMPASGSYPMPTQPQVAQPQFAQPSGPVSSLFTADRAANKKRGLFSCGSNPRQPMQIRSQNQSPEPKQFPGAEPGGVARVTPPGATSVRSSSCQSTSWTDSASESCQFLVLTTASGDFHDRAACRRISRLVIAGKTLRAIP
jgi:hypothetical protein